MDRVLALAALLLVLTMAGRLAAQPSCSPAVEAWAAACSEAEGTTVKPERCVPGGIIVSVPVAGGSLRVELARSPDRGFRRAGDIGVSPIGEFPDWSREPEQVQRAFDKVVRCVERNREGLIPGGDFAPQSRPGPLKAAPAPQTALPWRFLIGLAAAIAAFVTAMRGKGARTVLLNLAAPVVLFVFALVFRLAAVTPAFLHQNGHGAMWVKYALCQGSPYGSGFSALFGWAARLAGEAAERGVFAVQLGLSALVPACGFLLVRRAGGRPPLAWVAGLLLAIHPVLSRGARSESYYTACTSLLFLATAVLAVTGHSLKRKRPSFVLGVIASGFLIAQAALVHPVCWVAAALVPVVLMAGRGRPRARLRAAVAAALGIAVIVAATALPSMLRLLSDDTGGRWLSLAAQDMTGIAFAACASVVLLVLLLVPLGRLRRTLIPAAALVTVVLVEEANDMLRWPSSWALSWVWPLMFAPAFLFAAASTLGALLPARRQAFWAAAAIGVAGIAYTVSQWRVMTQLPTDALESIAVQGFRDRIPNGALLVYVRSAERHVQELPFYDECGGGRFTTIALSNDQPGFRIPKRADAFYYRSSICSTKPGRALCDDIERRHRLQVVEEATFPARESMPNLVYDTEDVKGVLYRVLSESR